MEPTTRIRLSRYSSTPSTKSSSFWLIDLSCLSILQRPNSVSAYKTAYLLAETPFWCWVTTRRNLLGQWCSLGFGWLVWSLYLLVSWSSTHSRRCLSKICPNSTFASLKSVKVRLIYIELWQQTLRLQYCVPTWLWGCTLEKGIAVSKPEQEVALAFCFRPRQPWQAIALRDSFLSRLFGEVLWGSIATCIVWEKKRASKRVVWTANVRVFREKKRKIWDEDSSVNQFTACSRE